MFSGPVDFYYFSGTGNTLLVVKKMQETLQEEGIEVELHKIEDSDPSRIDIEHTIGLAFPIAAFSTYPFVWEFIRGLPRAHGTEIFMVDTLGGFSGGIVGPLREIMKKKGYLPIGAEEIIMPPNIFYIQDEKTCQKKIAKGLSMADNYASKLVKGSAVWGRVPVLSDFMYTLSIGLTNSWKWKSQQKSRFGFQANKTKCNDCGICAELCPTNNIEINKYPVRRCNCEFCMRCVSFCPRKAIPCKLNYKGETYQAVKAKELLK